MLSKGVLSARLFNLICG
ncbi:protein YchT [Escherichia coli]